MSTTSVVITPKDGGNLCRSGDLPVSRDGGWAGEAQVPDGNLALACGSGGWLSAIPTVILGKEHP